MICQLSLALLHLHTTVLHHACSENYHTVICIGLLGKMKSWGRFFAPTDLLYLLFVSFFFFFFFLRSILVRFLTPALHAFLIILCLQKDDLAFYPPHHCSYLLEQSSASRWHCFALVFLFRLRKISGLVLCICLLRKMHSVSQIIDRFDTWSSRRTKRSISHLFVAL